MKNIFAAVTVITIFVFAAFCYEDTPGQAVFKSQDAIITVNIASSIYTYKVTNLNTDRITSFEIGQHASYNFIAPEGWEKKMHENIIHAYATKPSYAIEPNKTAEFSLRISSRGAVLGTAPAKLIFESGKTIIIPGVWAPVAEPKSYIVLVAGIIIAIILIHTFIVTRKRPQQS